MHRIVVAVDIAAVAVAVALVELLVLVDQRYSCSPFDYLTEIKIG
jgi:hypothetical protein